MDFSQEQIADFSLHQPNNSDPDPLDPALQNFDDSIDTQLRNAAAATEVGAVASVEVQEAVADDLQSGLNDGQNDQGEPHPSTPTRAWLSQSQKGQEVDLTDLVSQKDAVRALRKYTTLTNSEIFRRVGVSSSGGYRYLRGEEREKETRGRKRKLDETIVNRIIHEIESQPAGEKTKSWEELCKIVGVNGIAPVTLKRAVEGAGYYKCSHCQRVTKVHGLGKDKDSKEGKEGKDPKDSKDDKNPKAVITNGQVPLPAPELNQMNNTFGMYPDPSSHG